MCCGELGGVWDGFGGEDWHDFRMVVVWMVVYRGFGGEVCDDFGGRGVWWRGLEVDGCAVTSWEGFWVDFGGRGGWCRGLVERLGFCGKDWWRDLVERLVMILEVEGFGGGVWD